MRYIGKEFIFNYPKEFVTLPEYSKQRGKRVIVTRKLMKCESDFTMYEIVTQDCWVGVAWPDELEPINP